jgi:hypothetical protein
MTRARDPIYACHRYPAEIISYAVWLYFRFPLSLRMVEEMLASSLVKKAIFYSMLQNEDGFTHEATHKSQRAADGLCECDDSFARYDDPFDCQHANVLHGVGSCDGTVTLPNDERNYSPCTSLFTPR